jgi:hypothetical protein
MSDSVQTRPASLGVPATARSLPRMWGLFSPRFLAGLTALVAMAVSLRSIGGAMELYFRKEPVELKKPLQQLDRGQLGPEYGVHHLVPPLLSDDLLQSLGTGEYVNLRIVDERRLEDDPAKVADVFITYYTGQPDMVPHVPDECYLAGGFERVGQPETEWVTITAAGGTEEIPLRVLEFRATAGMSPGAGGRPAEERTLTVLYFFLCNDEYYTTRNQVRLKLGQIYERYAYYAKLEFRFFDYELRRPADRAAALAAVQPLLQKLMPLLKREHFADWPPSPPAAEGHEADGEET